MIFVSAGSAMESMADALRTSRQSEDKKLEKINWLLHHPALVTATEEFKQRPVMEFREAGGRPCFIYVSQKEYATASPDHVQFIGTDEATTCIGLGIRNAKSELTSIGHLDFVACVKRGVAQMLESVAPDEDTTLEVHLVGAYDDSLDTELKEFSEDALGHSWPLCVELVEVLQASPYRMQIQTICILQHNTMKGSSGYWRPVVRGLAIETSSGHSMPAYFSKDARGPDAVVRELSLSFDGSRTELKHPYDTVSDSFSVAPFQWSREWKAYAAYSLRMSDADLLLSRSTSPYAESSDFITSIRRLDKYLYEHPDWEETFPNKQSRRFIRDSSGRWIQINTMESRHG